MSAADLFTDRAGALRHAFDRSFAAPRAGVAAATADFLALRIAGDAYMVRLAEVGGIYVDKPITPVPGPLAELIGVAGFRGQIVPVYDLAALLGYSAQAGPRWIVSAAAAAVAFACADFEGHFRLAADAVTARTDAARERDGSGLVRLADATVPLIHLESVIAGIRRRLPAGTASQER
jgi:purine-binding chemotaxis protein CheW